MKYKIGILMMLLFVGGCGGTDETKGSEQEAKIDPSEEVIVTFKDENLETLIREELEKPTGDITSLDMQELYYLTINDIGVKNLEGLEYALELREFSIMREEVDSLEPLKNLDKLERLIIRYTEIENLPIEFNKEVNLLHVSIVGTIIEDVSFLEFMTNIDHLTMTDAGIEDISALENLVKVEQLNLRGNKIEDISALSEMHQLRYLNLQGNNVSTIEPLTDLESLYDVVLSYNPVYNLSPLRTLPALGVVVIYLDHEVKHLILDQVYELEKMGIDVSYHR